MPGAILCTIPQAARCIARSQSFIYEAMADGTIESVKSDKRRLVVIKSLHEYVDKLRGTATAA
jgi:hypothetical protein